MLYRYLLKKVRYNLIYGFNTLMGYNIIEVDEKVQGGGFLYVDKICEYMCVNMVGI